jgi:hypothetical protein
MNDQHENDPVSKKLEHVDPQAPPVYRKPVLRKYDQIEQVKPYGPSEFEAG